jgi:hypothetical protein
MWLIETISLRHAQWTRKQSRRGPTTTRSWTQPRHSWRIESWNQGARSAIEAALKSSVNDAVRHAKAAANLLVNDGHTEFLDLIHPD